MDVMISVDGSYTTYGPYHDGYKLDFSVLDGLMDDATMSFDIFDHKIRDVKLSFSTNNMSAYYTDGATGWTWCVINNDGTVGSHIKNLYFMFPTKPDDTVKPDSENEVNHPKHYTGHKADIECIMFTELLPSLAANAFKYVWRCDEKGNREDDLEKARWYLKRIRDRGFYDKRVGWKVRPLLLGIIDASDFDDWHKSVLSKIITGNYCTAYDNISSELEDYDDIFSQLGESDIF